MPQGISRVRVRVQRFRMSFMQEMNFKSCCFSLSASASVLSNFSFFNFLGADTASFGRLESAGSSLLYLKPSCAMPPPFSTKVGIDLLPLSAMLVAARLMAEAAWPLRLAVSTPAFCNPRDETVISHPSSLMVVSFPSSG